VLKKTTLKTPEGKATVTLQLPRQAVSLITLSY
jgi:hypothetical protein